MCTTIPPIRHARLSKPQVADLKRIRLISPFDAGRSTGLEANALAGAVADVLVRGVEVEVAWRADRLEWIRADTVTTLTNLVAL